MVSLKLSPLTKDESHWTMHYVRIVAWAKGSKELELDPRTNDDNQVKPIEETCTFQFNINEE